MVELAEQKNVFLGGDDFKSGQTKVKSVIADFLVSAGIKVCVEGRGWSVDGEGEGLECGWRESGWSVDGEVKVRRWSVDSEGEGLERGW